MNKFANINYANYQFFNACIIDKLVAAKYQDLNGTPINVASIGLVQGDALVIDNINNVILKDISVDAIDPYDFKIDGVNDYAIIPIDFTGAAAIDNYNKAIEIFIPLSTAVNQVYLIKSDPLGAIPDAGKFIDLQFINLNPPDLQAMVIQPVRLWFGTDIVFTTTITTTAIFIRNTNFNLMIKGVLDRSQTASYCLEDTRVSKSCGRIVYKVVTAGECNFGIKKETNSFQSTSPPVDTVSVKIINRGGNLVYTIFKNGVEQGLKTDIRALDGDRVCIQWGVSPSQLDSEYNNTVNSATNPAALDPVLSISPNSNFTDEDRGKLLFSVSRDATTQYFYLGSKFDTTVGQPDRQLCSVIPWTPRNNPYLAPLYWDNLNDYHAFVLPNRATIKLIELTRNPMVTTLDGVTKIINSDIILHDDTLHNQDHPELVNEPHKLDSFANYWYWVWNDLYFQKQMGYKVSSQYINAGKGSFMATTDYLTAYLPENLVIFLDNISSESYDLEKVKGLRRNIIGCASNAVGKIGEINVEPNNLYKIALNNKEAINIRKFLVSFETYFGEQIQLMTARAVVNLLFEPSK